MKNKYDSDYKKQDKTSVESWHNTALTGGNWQK